MTGCLLLLLVQDAEALRDLADPDPQAAWRGAHALVERGDRAVVPAAVKLLRDPRGGARMPVLHVLGRLGAPADGVRVAPLLDVEDPEVRLAALQALGEMRAIGQAAAAARFLGHPGGEFRQAAVRALGLMGSRVHAAAIAERLSDLAVIRWEAAKALAALGAREHAGAVAALLAEGAEPPVIEALGRLGRRDFAPQVVPFLEHAEPGIRWRAVEALGRMDAREDADDVVHLLHDTEHYVRLKAVRALGALGVRARDLAERIRDENHEVALAAAEETVYLGGPDEDGIVLASLESADLQTREAALVAATGRRLKAAEPILKVQLREAEGRQRELLQAALARLAEPEAPKLEARKRVETRADLEALLAGSGVAVPPGEPLRRLPAGTRLAARVWVDAASK
jgi:HEAT repeat protein